MLEFLKRHYAVIVKGFWLVMTLLATVICTATVGGFSVGTSYANALRDKSAIEEDVSELKRWRVSSAEKQEMVERKLIRMDGNLEILMRAMDVKPLPKVEGAD